MHACVCVCVCVGGVRVCVWARVCACVCCLLRCVCVVGRRIEQQRGWNYRLPLSALSKLLSFNIVAAGRTHHLWQSAGFAGRQVAECLPTSGSFPHLCETGRRSPAMKVHEVIGLLDVNKRKFHRCSYFSFPFSPWKIITNLILSTI